MKKLIAGTVMVVMVVLAGLISGCGSDEKTVLPQPSSMKGVKNAPELFGVWDSVRGGFGSVRFKYDGFAISQGGGVFFVGEYSLDGDIVYFNARDFKGADILAYDYDDSAKVTFSSDRNSMTWTATANTKTPSLYPIIYNKSTTGYF